MQLTLRTTSSLIYTSIGVKVQLLSCFPDVNIQPAAVRCPGWKDGLAFDFLHSETFRVVYGSTPMLIHSSPDRSRTLLGLDIPGPPTTAGALPLLLSSSFFMSIHTGGHFASPSEHLPKVRPCGDPHMIRNLTLLCTHQLQGAANFCSEYVNPWIVLREAPSTYPFQLKLMSIQHMDKPPLPPSD